MIKGKTVNMEIKKALYDSIIVPTLIVRETWMQNKGQRSAIQAVEIKYLRGGCGLNSMGGESNKSVYGKFGMSVQGEGRYFGVEVVKHSTLR